MAKKKPGKTLAQQADKYHCYQESVQAPSHEIEFFEQAFRESFGRKPQTLREDFCGTFAVCCEWVKSNSKRTALGVDLDPEPLAWGKEHNLKQLAKTQRDRVKLQQKDVLARSKEKFDVLAAQNFSFWLFKTRDEVCNYFQTARSHLNEEGILVMDMMGGGGCYEEGQRDVKKIGKGKRRFKYYWEQACFNPITHDATFYISFKFPDGSKLKKIFEYHWRFWTIREVRELLAEAGFRESHVYWEIVDKDGEDTGEWERVEDADSDLSWICYVVGVK